MDMLICNKCYAPINRGKQPYSITQCYHVFCQECLQQAQIQCTQCGCNALSYLPLKEPMNPTLSSLFTPLTEILQQLQKVDIFRNTQLKITMQRFYELDKKYDMLKKQYWAIQQNVKIMMNKFNNLRIEKEKLEKKLQFFDIQGASRHMPTQMHSKMNTPTNSNTFFKPSSSGYSSESMDLQSIGITPAKPQGVTKLHKVSSGFSMPIKRSMKPGSVYRKL